MRDDEIRPVQDIAAAAPVDGVRLHHRSPAAMQAFATARGIYRRRLIARRRAADATPSTPAPAAGRILDIQE